MNSVAAVQQQSIATVAAKSDSIFRRAQICSMAPKLHTKSRMKFVLKFSSSSYRRENRTEKIALPTCTRRKCYPMIPIEGYDVVVIGRSNIVGIPLAMLLLHRNATVQICHRHSMDVKEKARRADILVVAAGSPGLIREDWVKPGAVVIDVGINAVDDSSSARGYRVIGDEVKGVAAAVSPVPGVAVCQRDSKNE